MPSPDHQEPTRVEIALVRAARAVRRAFDVRLASLGLTMSHASLLSFVRDLGPLTQRELADRMYVGKAAVGSFIDALEGRDLVRRYTDPSDRRVWRIKLTPAGDRLVAEFDHADAQLRTELRAGITRRERELLANLLLRLERNAMTSVERTPTPAG
jgi:MarR family transcriptional regulator for hemolysin